jgi:hypothetical protein
MKRSTRIILSIVAYIVCHFALHIIFLPEPGDMTATGLISLLNICAAASTYIYTGKKKTS